METSAWVRRKIGQREWRGWKLKQVDGNPEDGAGAVDGVVCGAVAEKAAAAAVVGMAVVVEYVDSAVVP